MIVVDDWQLKDSRYLFSSSSGTIERDRSTNLKLKDPWITLFVILELSDHERDDNDGDDDHLRC